MNSLRVVDNCPSTVNVAEEPGAFSCDDFSKICLDSQNIGSQL